MPGRSSPDAVRREYDDLFIGLVRGEVLPYASYYLTGFLNEKPLALLRRDMARLGIARTPDVQEPEDHIASICEMMAGLIRGRFGGPVGLTAQREFFAAHLAPWAEHFFGDLEGAKNARFLRARGRDRTRLRRHRARGFPYGSPDGAWALAAPAEFRSGRERAMM